MTPHKVEPLSHCLQTNRNVDIRCSKGANERTGHRTHTKRNHRRTGTRHLAPDRRRKKGHCPDCRKSHPAGKEAQADPNGMLARRCSFQPLGSETSLGSVAAIVRSPLLTLAAKSKSGTGE